MAVMLLHIRHMHEGESGFITTPPLTPVQAGVILMDIIL